MSVDSDTLELPAVPEPRDEPREPRDLFPAECLVWRTNDPCPRVTGQTCECAE